MKKPNSFAKNLINSVYVGRLMNAILVEIHTIFFNTDEHDLSKCKILEWNKGEIK